MVSPNTMKRGFEGMDLSIPDPGTGKALPSGQTGVIALTIAAGVAETNTLADPARASLELTLVVSSLGVGGSRTITTASPYNRTGDVTITLNASRDMVIMRSVPIGTGYKWDLIYTGT